MGDGKCIRVWDDAWLDGGGSGRVMSPRGEFPVGTTLDVFIDQESRTWKTDLVRASFLSFEVYRILSTPIRQSNNDDELIWSLSSDGIFVSKMSMLTLCPLEMRRPLRRVRILLGVRYGNYMCPRRSANLLGVRAGIFYPMVSISVVKGSRTLYIVTGAGRLRL